MMNPLKKRTLMKLLIIAIGFFLSAIISCTFTNPKLCNEEQAKITNKYAQPYWEKVKRIIDSVSADFAKDSIIGKTNKKVIEDKYEQLFKSVVGQDSNVYAVSLAISYPDSLRVNYGHSVGYYDNKTPNKMKRRTTYFTFWAESDKGTRIQIYPERVEYENDSIQLIRFFNYNVNRASKAFIDFSLEIKVPNSLDIKCLDSVNYQ